jgi:hypothetical protein
MLVEFFKILISADITTKKSISEWAIEMNFQKIPWGAPRNRDTVKIIFTPSLLWKPSSIAKVLASYPTKHFCSIKEYSESLLLFRIDVLVDYRTTNLSRYGGME